MKLTDLHEMTMRVSSYESLGKYLYTFDSFVNQEHVGDIESFRVFKKSGIPVDKYALIDGDKAVAFFEINPDEKVLEVAYVSPTIRKKGVFSAFLFFLKRNEGYSKIVLGDLHSQDTIDAVKKIHNRFETYWEKDGEKRPYSPSTVDDFYSIRKPTGWKIVLENDGDFSKWPKFFEGTNPKTHYFEALDL